jgi:hypothetical protein
MVGCFKGWSVVIRDSRTQTRKRVPAAAHLPRRDVKGRVAAYVAATCLHAQHHQGADRFSMPGLNGHHQGGLAVACLRVLADAPPHGDRDLGGDGGRGGGGEVVDRQVDGVEAGVDLGGGGEGRAASERPGEWEMRSIHTQRVAALPPHLCQQPFLPFLVRQHQGDCFRNHLHQLASVLCEGCGHGVNRGA